MDTVMEGIRKETKEKPRDFLSTAVRDSTTQHPPDDSLSRAAAADDDDDDVKERQLASSVIRSSCTEARARETLRTEARAPDHRAEWAEEEEGASGISLGLLPLEWEDHISSREHQQTQAFFFPAPKALSKWIQWSQFNYCPFLIMIIIKGEVWNQNIQL